VVKQIGVAGYECEDITIYLAGILNKLGKKTAIVDRSEQEILCEILGIQADEERAAREREYYGIRISNQSISTEEFDVVFHLFGYRLNHPKIYDCEDVLMVTDGVPAHASLLNRPNLKGFRRYLLIRNLVALRYTAEYLAELADNKNNYFELQYDEKDIRQRCGICAYGGFKIKRLSAGMKCALLEVLCYLTDEYPKRKIFDVMKKM